MGLMQDATLQLILAAVALLLTFGAAVKLAVVQSEKALNSERKAREELEKRLKDELQRKTTDEAELRHRVKGLEEQRLMDASKIETLEGQHRTLLTEMAALQAQVKTLQADLEQERDEKARALTERDELRARLADVERTLTTVTTQRDELRGLIAGRLEAGAVVGVDPVEGKPSTKDVKEAARRVNAAVDARLRTGEHASAVDAGERVTDVGDTGQQGG